MLQSKIKISENVDKLIRHNAYLVKNNYKNNLFCSIYNKNIFILTQSKIDDILKQGFIN